MDAAGKYCRRDERLRASRDRRAAASRSPLHSPFPSSRPTASKNQKQHNLLSCCGLVCSRLSASFRSVCQLAAPPPRTFLLSSHFTHGRQPGNRQQAPVTTAITITISIRFFRRQQQHQKPPNLLFIYHHGQLLASFPRRTPQSSLIITRQRDISRRAHRALRNPSAAAVANPSGPDSSQRLRENPLSSSDAAIISRLFRLTI